MTPEEQQQTTDGLEASKRNAVYLGEDSRMRFVPRTAAGVNAPPAVEVVTIDAEREERLHKRYRNDNLKRLEVLFQREVERMRRMGYPGLARHLHAGATDANAVARWLRLAPINRRLVCPLCFPNAAEAKDHPVLVTRETDGLELVRCKRHNGEYVRRAPIPVLQQLGLPFVDDGPRPPPPAAAGAPPARRRRLITHAAAVEDEEGVR